MKYCIVTFRSVTLAQRGERILRRAGFHCILQRTLRWMEEQGCGYSLKIRHADLAKCLELLQNGQLAYRKVYLLRDNGNVEAIEP